MTVDWSNWMQLTTEQQNELWRRYRETVRREAENLKAYPARLNAALAGVTLPPRRAGQQP